MGRTVAILGAAGSLGKNLCRLAPANGHSVVAIDSDENRLALLCRCHRAVEGHLLDIRDTESVLRLIWQTGVRLVVNCAARKHVGWCEQNATEAIEVNAMASFRLTSALETQRYIYIGTDKSVKPACTYALSKLLGERDAIEKGHSVVRGVNFLFSGGSVLDIWENQRGAGVPFTVVMDPDCARYCMTLDEAAELVWRAALSDRPGMFYPEWVYRISPLVLFRGYCLMANVANPTVAEIPLSSDEKMTEDLDFDASVESLTEPESVAELLRKAVVWK